MMRFDFFVIVEVTGRKEFWHPYDRRSECGWERRVELSPPVTLHEKENKKPGCVQSRVHKTNITTLCS